MTDLSERDNDSYLAKIRQAMQRLSPSDNSDDDARNALLAVADTARINVDVPIVSQRRYTVFVKHAVKRLTRWYFRYVGEQISALGQSLVQLGTAILYRTERLDEQASVLRADVMDLTSRIERLEEKVHGK
jgi:hypothetical protein